MQYPMWTGGNVWFHTIKPYLYFRVSSVRFNRLLVSCLRELKENEFGE